MTTKSIFGRCIVMKCKNTKTKNPRKLFFRVPYGEDRYRWWLAAGQPQMSNKSVRWCCEDHFSLPNDVEHYLRYKLLKESGKDLFRLKLKQGILPHINIPTHNEESWMPDSLANQVTTPEEDAAFCGAMEAKPHPPSKLRKYSKELRITAQDSSKIDFGATPDGFSLVNFNGDLQTLNSFQKEEYGQGHATEKPINQNKRSLSQYQTDPDLFIQGDEEISQKYVTETVVKQEYTGLEDIKVFEETNFSIPCFGSGSDNFIDPTYLTVPINNENEHTLKIQELVDPLDLGSLKHYVKQEEVMFSDWENEETRPKLSCSECSAKFNGKGMLNIHMKKHTGEYPVTCSYCLDTFPRKSDLKVHMKSHPTKGPFVCFLCRAGFSHKATLLGHVREHKGKTRLPCSQCPAIFTSTRALSNHLESHKDFAPYRLKQEESK